LDLIKIEEKAITIQPLLCIFDQPPSFLGLGEILPRRIFFSFRNFMIILDAIDGVNQIVSNYKKLID